MNADIEPCASIKFPRAAVELSSGSYASDDDMPLSEIDTSNHYTCSTCGFKLESKEKLISHLSTNCQETKKTKSRKPQRKTKENIKVKKNRVCSKKKIEYNCLDCNSVFQSKSKLKLHSKNYHNHVSKCSICEECFQSYADYSAHIELHDPEDRIVCKNCHAEFKTLKSYRTHAKLYPKPHNFSCINCMRKFKSESRLEDHVCICTNGEPLLCACGQNFSAYPDVVSHARGPKPFYCCTCDHQSSSLTSHLRHIRKHSKQKPYICKKCGASFSMAEFLNQHIKAAHRPDADISIDLIDPGLLAGDKSATHVSCTDCGKMVRPNRLATHREKHKLSSCLCPECGKLFESPMRLPQHMISAHNKDPVTCDICNKQLKTKKILSEHLKTHLTTEVGSRVAQAICPICGLALAQKGSLARHILLVHERHRLAQDDVPRVCKECGMTLPNKAKYYTHRRQHRAMTERYPCTVCNREFNKKQNLVRHMYLLHDSRRVMEDPSFTCQLCCRSFRERKNLIRHCRLVH